MVVIPQSVLLSAFSAHAAAVFNAAWHLLGDRPAAEDVLQEAFLALARQETCPDAPRGWLLTVALNRARDLCRRHAPQLVAGVDEVPAPENGPMVAAIRGERAVSVQAALAALPIEQREVVVLHVFEELSFRAIGELCGCSGETAASRWRYACERLRRGPLRRMVAADDGVDRVDNQADRSSR